jgi:hypothetical protein
MPRDGSAWRATRTLWSALISGSPETRYILLWTALESLFGPASGQELSFRIAQRIALFLEQSVEPRKAVFQTVRSAYNLRSQVVHGRPIKKIGPEKADEHTLKTETVLRSSLTAILESPELVARFSDEKQRDAYLDVLALL